MSGVIAIQFTQDQMRSLTGVSAETARHWRRTIPYLRAKTGKAARFTFADLLGLAVTHEIVNSLGVHIGTVSEGVDALFHLLADSATSIPKAGVALVTPNAASLHELGSWSLGRSGQPTLAIPLDPLLSRLQQYVLPLTPPPSQVALPFPPEAVRSRA